MSYKSTYTGAQIDSAVAFAQTYAEGTYLPTLGGNSTYWGQQGKYKKIGNMVLFSGLFIVNAIGSGSTNTISIAGIPYTPVSSSEFGVTVVYYDQLVSNVVQVIGNIDTSKNIALLSATAASGSLSANNLFQNSSDFRFNGFFFIA